MREFARMTVVGSTRRSDLVIPGDVVIAAVLPRILDLLGEQPGPVTRPLTLLRTTGEQLDPGLTAIDHRLVDGELLRLVRADEAPPPPEVADVTEVLGDSMAGRVGRWSDAARSLTGVLATGVLALVCAGLLPGHLGAGVGPHEVLVAELAAVALLVAAAVATGLCGLAWGSRAATAAALGCCVPIAIRWALPGNPTAIGWVLPFVTGLGLLVWPCLGAGFGIARRSRPALAGSALGLGLLAVPLLVSPLGPTGAATAGAAAAVVSCGLLPRYATILAGLTRLDDVVLAGQLRTRDEVSATIDQAYASLTWASFGVATGLVGTAGVLLASGDEWALAIGLAVVVVTALRTRGFPLIAQQSALWLAVAGAIAQGVAGRSWPDPGLLAVLLATLAGVVAMLSIPRPAPHIRAALRKAGNLLELLAVLAMAPLILGFFGVYADLLDAF